jgi:acyl carrier protein
MSSWADLSPKAGVPTDLEALTAEVWSQLLGIEIRDPETNYIDLGAHSLLIVLVRDRLHDVTGVEIAPRVIWECATIRQLSATVEAAGRDRDRANAIRRDHW